MKYGLFPSTPLRAGTRGLQASPESYKPERQAPQSLNSVGTLLLALSAKGLVS